MNDIQFAQIIKTICDNARERGGEIMYMDKTKDGSIVLMPLDAVYDKFVNRDRGN